MISGGIQSKIVRMPITVSSLIYYPIKACRGIEVQSVEVERMGLANDRRMMVVTENGDFLTKREYPRLAWVVPTINKDALTLSALDYDSIRIPVQTSGSPVLVNVWSSKNVQAVDQGDAAAQWFSDWLKASVRLVHIADGFQRRVNPQYAIDAVDHTGFADGYPILIISEESLADLNTRLETELPMNRFRPNIVVKGCEPYAEDTWNKLCSGDVKLAVVKPCARCEVTTIDKDTLVRSKEPLKTLGAYRKHALGAIFGQNGIPLNGGRLSVGMNVDVIL